jgi:hypothetical protein
MTIRLTGALLCGAVCLFALSTGPSRAQEAGAGRYGGMQFNGTASQPIKQGIGHESTHVIQQGKGGGARMGGGGGKGAAGRTTTVKSSKSNTSDRMGGGGGKGGASRKGNPNSSRCN